MLGCLGSNQYCAIINNATINNLLFLYFRRSIFKDRIARSKGKPICTTYCQIVFHRGCIILHSHQQYMIVSVYLNCCQCNEWEMVCQCSLMYTSLIMSGDNFCIFFVDCLSLAHVLLEFLNLSFYSIKNIFIYWDISPISGIFLGIFSPNLSFFLLCLGFFFHVKVFYFYFLWGKTHHSFIAPGL